MQAWIVWRYWRVRTPYGAQFGFSMYTRL